MKKKIVSCSIVVALTLEMVTPLAASDWFDGYETGSAPKSWTDGGGGKYFYGGDFTYRFKRNTAFKPMFEMKPPGIKAGCNGVSVSGGFIHFLGLDEIKQQLQSAGQGAMMGVIVGIVYSLPGIADAFDKVQKYVRLLQQLLGQSCQMAATATKHYIDSVRAQKDSSGNVTAPAENDIGRMFDSLNSTVDGWTDSLNQGPDMEKSKIMTYLQTDNPEKRSPSTKALIMCNKTCQLIKKDADAEIKAYVQGNAVNQATYVDTTIDNLNQIIKDDKLRNVLFSMMFIGYYGTKHDQMPTELSKDDFASQVVQQIGTGGSPIGKSIFQKGLFYSATNPSGKKVVDILLNGTDGSMSNNVIYVPKIPMRVYYSETNSSDGNYADVASAVLFGEVSEADSSNTFQYTWAGLIPSGISYLQDVIMNNNVNAVPTIPSVFPGMTKYINVLRVEHRAGQSDAYINSLISLLAKKNAVMLLQSIVYEMQSMVYSTQDKELQDTQKQAIDDIYKELERLNQSDSSIADTIEIFERIEREHAVAITGGLKK